VTRGEVQEGQGGGHAGGHRSMVRKADSSNLGLYRHTWWPMPGRSLVVHTGPLPPVLLNGLGRMVTMDGDHRWWWWWVGGQAFGLGGQGQHR
jgi:hypothetical protein